MGRGWVRVLVALAVLALGALACTEGEEVRQVGAELAITARDDWGSLCGQAREFQAAVVDGTVEQLSPSWADK